MLSKQNERNVAACWRSDDQSKITGQARTALIGEGWGMSAKCSTVTSYREERLAGEPTPFWLTMPKVNWQRLLGGHRARVGLNTEDQAASPY
jgi:hypothetical protein